MNIPLQPGQLSPAPGVGSRPVTPSDTTEFAPPIRSLRVTGAGDVCFVGADGQEDTWTCSAFDMIPVAMTKVKATGTTATGLKGIL
jgi:hypothetical protein